MLYLIGLGLNIDGISTYGLDIVKKCKRVYIENYTVEYPYSTDELGDLIGKKLIPADREKVESLDLIDEAKKMDVALLVYGSPLFATTHITLIQEAKASEVRYKVLHNTSIFDALGETGLQLYKFGKIASLPNLEADSYMEIVKENKSIDAHSLILVDIGMEFKEALERLKEDAKKNKIKLDKIVICQALGTRHRKIIYREVSKLEGMNIRAPFCFIIPGKLHFLEKEVLEGF